MSNAFIRAVDENGYVDSWVEAGEHPAYAMLRVMKIYILNVEECKNRDTSNDCYTNQTHKTLNGLDFSVGYKTTLVLPDGTIIHFKPDNTECGWIEIDTNGNKPPNQWGRNLFAFKYDPFFHPNMDYLHCSGLSWEGKHSCKK